MFNSDTFQKIADTAFQNAVESAVKEVIAKNAGYGLESTVKDLIQKEAARIIKDDPEFSEMIRESLRYWINEAGSKRI